MNFLQYFIFRFKLVKIDSFINYQLPLYNSIEKLREINKIEINHAEINHAEINHIEMKSIEMKSIEMKSIEMKNIKELRGINKEKIRNMKNLKIINNLETKNVGITIKLKMIQK